MVEHADTERLDELVDGRKIVSPGDPNELDLVAIGFVNRYDRSGFGTTRRSPRRPEPQQTIRALESIEVDLPAGRRRRPQFGGGTGAAGLVRTAARGSDHGEKTKEPDPTTHLDKLTRHQSGPEVVLGLMRSVIALIWAQRSDGANHPRTHRGGRRSLEPPGLG